MSVISIQQNYWLYDSDIRDVGGVLGLSYSCKGCNSLWNFEDPETLPQFGVFLGEGTDYSWWEKAKDNFILQKRESSLVLGVSAKSVQLDRGEGKILKLVSKSENGVDWFFPMSRFRYKSTDLLTKDTSLHFSLAIAGIGLPEEIYTQFAKMIKKLNQNVICV